VQDEHGVVDMTLGVAVRRAEGAVVEAKFGQGFAGMEVEVARGVVALLNGGDG
jgi:hypothetical protein